MSQCRSCQQPIKWIRLRPALKPHPIDPMPKKVIVLSETSTDGSPHGKTVDGYTSHFATCPQADDWRNK